MLAHASLGVVGDYYLDKANYDLYGPKTSSGWGSPISIKGADGNANVTRYIFPGHDFRADDSWRISVTTYMDINSESELAQNAYLVYLKNEGTTPTYYPVSGPGSGASPSYYRLMIYWASTIDSGSIQINLTRLGVKLLTTLK